MQILILALAGLLLVGSPNDAVVSKSGVFMNSVVLLGPDAHVGLYNHSSESVDLSGWSLNHETKAAKKGDWVLPQGSSIGAGETLVIANSAQAYKKAHGKAPDFELATGEGVTDDDDVDNLQSAEGAGEIRTNDEGDGALVLRDKDGRMKSHMGFRPESPPHVVAEQQQWNEIPTAEELALEAAGGAEATGDAGASAEAAQAKVADKLAALAATGAAKGGVDNAAGTGASAAGSGDGTATGAESPTATAESGNLWPWIGGILALLIGFIFLRRRDA
jgi:hypothetical protein